jgi:DNA polymerase-1
MSLDFISFLKDLELNSLVKKISDRIHAPTSQAHVAHGSQSTTESRSNVVYNKIKSEKAHDRLVAELQRQGRFALTIQHDGEDRGSFAIATDSAVYSLATEVKDQRMQYLKRLVPCLEQCEVITDQGKDLLRFFLDAELLTPKQVLATKLFDVSIAQYVLDPEEKLSFDDLIGKFSDELPSGYALAKAASQQQGQEPAQTPEHLPEHLIEQKALALYALAQGPLLRSLKEQSQAITLFWQIEAPLVPVLAVMEWHGIAVDPQVLQKLSVEFDAEQKKLISSIHGLAGEEFNLNSPKQLAEILFTKLGLPTVKKTKTGFSTDVEVLEKLSHTHEVPKLLLRYREITKLKSTYVDVLPQLIGADGRVHAKFNQTVTATGRLSSSDPNLQNIPVKSDSGRLIRSAFVPGPHSVFVSADYSQIELRIVAHLSDDPMLIRAFQEDKDVHRYTAAEIFGIAENAVSDEQRQVAKAINFGLIYGKTAFGLAGELGISKAEAQGYIDHYFKRYAGVKAFMDQCLVTARETGMATTLFGRRRRIRDILSKNMALRNNAERMAMNTPVQGTAADIMKLAMLKIAPLAWDMGAKLVLQVHDELVLDVPAEQESNVRAMLKETMETAVALKVPLKVNDSSGPNWMVL